MSLTASQPLVRTFRLSSSRAAARRPAAANRLRIGFIGFDGVSALDLTAPLEAFSTAINLNSESDNQPTYELVVIGIGQKHFSSEGGVVFRSQTMLRTVRDLDTVIIPGGNGWRRAKAMVELSVWL